MSSPDPSLGVLSDSFVGRSGDLAELEADLRALPLAAGPVRMLRGLAGVGKTRLAEELSRRAAACGVTVAWAHISDELAAPAYWPWTQVVRRLQGRTRGTDLAELVLEGSTAVDVFELFDATAAVVRAATDRGPLLVVLDDLHAADPGTLQLTRFLARHLSDVPLMLFATVQTDAPVTPAVSEHLDALARLGATRELAGLGVDAAAEDFSRPAVRVIGGFEVTDLTGSPARWTSRKARELLKILVSRRGAPVSRETLMDLLWPGDDPALLGNRLSVALSTIRRALDPQRRLPPADLVSTAFDAVWLNLEVVDVDVEKFLEGARTVLAECRSQCDDRATAAVGVAVELLDRHRGEALPDEPHAEWAEAIRSEIHLAVTTLARFVAETAEKSGDHLQAVEAHSRVLEIDPYDEVANVGLITAYRAMGSHGQASTAFDSYVRRMSEIGISVSDRVPLWDGRSLR